MLLLGRGSGYCRTAHRSWLDEYVKVSVTLLFASLGRSIMCVDGLEWSRRASVGHHRGIVVDVVERGTSEGSHIVLRTSAELRSDTELDLTFQRVQIMRKSRFPRWFGKISFRLSSRLLRRLNRDKEERGP